MAFVHGQQELRRIGEGDFQAAAAGDCRQRLAQVARDDESPGANRDPRGMRLCEVVQATNRCCLPLAKT